MGKYFTEQERYKLEGYLDAKMKVKEIAVLLGKSERTIFYEIKRGTVTLLNKDYTYRTGYQADVAQRKYEENRINKGAPLKIGNDMKFVRHVEDIIQNWINNYPRKIFSGKSSNQKYKELDHINIA